eukprot:COSAG02_NODE_3457_length_6701_cov_4.671160_2_plen_84_part_00
MLSTIRQPAPKARQLDPPLAVLVSSFCLHFGEDLLSRSFVSRFFVRSLFRFQCLFFCSNKRRKHLNISGQQALVTRDSYPCAQ